jgi:hypothetical protein
VGSTSQSSAKAISAIGHSQWRQRGGDGGAVGAGF